MAAKSELALSPFRCHRILTGAASPRLRFTSDQHFTRWKSKVRAKLRDLLRPPQNKHRRTKSRTIWRRDTPLGSIEKIVFTAEPGADVPAYFCLPFAAKKPLATFICLQGHGSGIHQSIAVDRDDESKPVAPTNDSDFGLQCMRRGIAALCVEMRCFGQRREQEMPGRDDRSACNESVMRAEMLGRTLNGERVFDVDRALDWLALRGEISKSRVGIMGHSSGGLVAMYSAALLRRIAFCMTSCSCARFADSFLAMHHCACNTLPDAMSWFEMDDIFGAIAPKPLVVVNGRDDRIFPIDSARQCFRHIRRIYRAANANHACKFIAGGGGHRFYADSAWQVMLRMIQ